MLKRKTAVAAAVAVLLLNTSIVPSAYATDDAPLILSADAAVPGDPVGILSDTLTSWSYQDDWTSAAQGQPADYFATRYPEIKVVDLFGATGGGYVSEAEHFAYYVSSPTSAQIEALFQTSVEAPSNLKFWIAGADQESFDQLTSFTYTDQSAGGGEWVRRTYSLTNFPAGTSILRISFPTGGVNAYNPQVGRVSISGGQNIVDNLNDWSLVGQKSPNLVFDTAHAGPLGDTSRVMRTVNDRFTPAESVIYESGNLTGATVKALFSGDESIDDLIFFSSEDGNTWRQLVSVTRADAPVGSWTARTYQVGNVPANAGLLKVQFPTGGAASYNPQLGDVAISGPNPLHDPLNDWSIAKYWTSGLAFDSQNSGVFGDSSRVQRTNNFDGFPDVVVTRDLFKNPQDRNTLDDYDFEPLMVALKNVVRQGLTPKIRLANVPIKFTSQPVIGSFRTNVAPPDDYDAYRDYLVAMVEAAVSEFGLEAVRSWVWGLTPEIENVSWFRADDGTASSTKQEFFKLYDYTVDAVEQVLGAENVVIGAHMMPQSPGLWNPLEFLDHVATGVNLATGQVGSHLDYIDFSYYEGGEGNTGQLETTDGGALGLAESVNKIRQYADSIGLDDLTYDIPENGIGFDRQNRFILNNILGSGYEASLDALIFKRLNDLDIRAWSRWALNTERVWGGVSGVSSHLNQMASWMEGDARLAVNRHGAQEDPTSVVDAVMSVSAADHTVRALAFNHNPSPDAETDEKVKIRIDNVQAVSGTTVSVRTFRVDDNNASFWSQWWQDRTAHGVSNVTANNFSPYSLTVPAVMTVQGDKDFWYSKENTYRQLAQLTSTVTTAQVIDGSVSIDAELAQHGVAFFEITGVDVASSPAVVERTIDDPMDSWHRANAHSEQLDFDSQNAAALQDSSRVRRTAAGTAAAQTVDYWMPAARSAVIAALFATDTEAIQNLTFATSADGRHWASATVSQQQDSPVNSGLWTKREYRLDFPSGVNYVRVKVAPGGAAWWNPQIADVRISSLALGG